MYGVVSSDSMIKVICVHLESLGKKRVNTAIALSQYANICIYCCMPEGGVSEGRHETRAGNPYKMKDTGQY